LAQRGITARQLMRRLAGDYGVAAVSGDAFGLAGHALRLSTGMVDGPALDVALRRLFAGIAALLATG